MTTTVTAAAAMVAGGMNRHVVVPGQVVAVISEQELEDEDDENLIGASGSGEGAFLRGHGTYVEEVVVHPSGGKRQLQRRLVASVAGTVERVNKLLTVIPSAASSLYVGQVGDLVVGRITAVGSNRWRVGLDAASGSGKGGACRREGQLPLSGVTLPGGAQRIRTARDALDMRHVFGPGDVVSAEVSTLVNQGSTLMLHTRSLRYGKLENGVLLFAPPALIQRRQSHFVTLTLNEQVTVDVLLGLNGGIWIQRSLSSHPSSGNEEDKDAPLATTLQRARQWHASHPLLPEERREICRLRNAMEALRLVYRILSPETIRRVYDASLTFAPSDMMKPEVICQITASVRNER